MVDHATVSEMSKFATMSLEIKVFFNNNNNK